MYVNIKKIKKIKRCTNLRVFGNASFFLVSLKREILHNKLHFLFCFLKQLSSHLDPVNGDCEAVEAPCPFHSIGCPDAEVSYKTFNFNYRDPLIFF